MFSLTDISIVGLLYFSLILEAIIPIIPSCQFLPDKINRDIFYRSPNIDKARKDLLYEPSVKLDEGLKMMLDEKIRKF